MIDEFTLKLVSWTELFLSLSWTGQGVVLLQEPLGVDTGKHISVLWGGGHYDLLLLDQKQSFLLLNGDCSFLVITLSGVAGPPLG
jgi:hypothetical protein